MTAALAARRSTGPGSREGQCLRRLAEPGFRREHRVYDEGAGPTQLTADGHRDLRIGTGHPAAVSVDAAIMTIAMDTKSSAFPSA